MPSKKTATPVKKTVTKNTATAKKAAAPAKSTTPAKKRASPRPVKVVDYRLMHIQKTVAIVDDEVERKRLEDFCVEVVRQAQLLAHARTDAGVAYREHLSEVASAARTVAMVSLTGDAERVDDVSAGLTDELDNSPFANLVREQFDYGTAPESFRIVQFVLYEQEVDLAFALRGID